MIWRLDNGARTYLPRMAGALTAISPVPSNAACYVLTQADNTIRMVHFLSQSRTVSFLLLACMFRSVTLSHGEMRHFMMHNRFIAKVFEEILGAGERGGNARFVLGARAAPAGGGHAIGDRGRAGPWLGRAGAGGRRLRIAIL